MLSLNLEPDTRQSYSPEGIMRLLPNYRWMKCPWNTKTALFMFYTFVYKWVLIEFLLHLVVICLHTVINMHHWSVLIHYAVLSNYSIMHRKDKIFILLCNDIKNTALLVVLWDILQCQQIAQYMTDYLENVLKIPLNLVL